MKLIPQHLFLYAIAVALSWNSVVWSDEDRPSWPQWRGPSRDGQVEQSWPDELTEERLQLLWSVPLGKSYSGPIVADHRVFTTASEDKSEVVVALDRDSGKELWRQQWEGAVSVPFFAKENGDWIRATPAYDGQSLYVAGMRDNLVCLNAETGEIRWRVDFVEKFQTPVPAFGFVSSPLVDGDHVYVQAAAAVIKLDKRTGEVVWRTLADGGGMLGSAFSSPVIATLAGKRQLVVQTRDRLAGIDLDTGNALWSEEIPAFRGMNILTPTIIGDRIFTSAYGGKSLLFEVRREADAFQLQPLWENKVQGYMSTPVVIDGHAYMHLRNQRVTCIDLATGKETWTTRPFGKYWSLVACGSKILGLDERGELFLLKANAGEFETHGTLKISDDSTWAHLAVCGDQLFVRELNSMKAFSWK